MISLERLTELIDKHLSFGKFSKEIPEKKWAIKESVLGGRGIIATKDIKPGEILFVDHPLVYGPSACSIIERGCSVCGKINIDTFKCVKCCLVICSDKCQETDIHKKDCGVISRWKNKVPFEDIDSSVLSQALTAIRVLTLSDEKLNLMTVLQAHSLPQHGSEILKLKQYFEIPEDEEQLMVLACRILDTNAFKISTRYGRKETSLRGLYPVAGLMNHNCESNTRYCFNEDHQMTVKAVKPIIAGSEIHSCYSSLLWGTPARRTHLYKTKHFLCKCQRCSDPTERGTLLSALKCFATECPGLLLPKEPLNSSATWKCIECDMKVPFKNICALQGALGSLMGTVDFENVSQIEWFLQERITKFVPRMNQIVVDLECRIIWAFGEVDGYRWHELSEKRLGLKERYCRGVLRTLALLEVGDAYIKGLLFYHLHATLAERARREPVLFEGLKDEIEMCIEQAYRILKGDVSAPPDLELRRRYLGPGCGKPIEERLSVLNL